MIVTMRKVKTIHDLRYRVVVSELTRERIRLSISQDQLAKQIGMNQSDISKIEKHEKRLDILEFSLILKALRISENEHLQAIIKRFLGVS